MKLCRNTFSRLFVALALISSLVVPPGFCQETEDSQVFISGFNAYQQKDYAGAIAKMNEVLQKYPDTPLRDMALFWLSRAYFKSGNQQDAARFMSQFSKEYPDNPLRGTVEEELLALTSRYEKGEKLSSGASAAGKPVQTAALKAKIEKDRLAKEQADKEQLARKLAEQERITAAKAEEERIVAVKAEEARAAAASAAEQARLAALKAEEDRQASQKAEQQRLAALKSEEERNAAAKAEEARIAVENEKARLATLKAEQDRQAAAKIEQERAASRKAEEERIAVSEKNRLASIKVEEERKAAEQAEQARIAALKAEQDRQAAAKIEQEQAAAKKAEEERIAVSEKNRLASIKTEEDRKAAEQAEQVRIAALKAEEDRQAAVKAEQVRIAAEETARQAAQKLEQERLARVQAEEQRLARERAEEQRLALLKAEQERTAAEKVAKEQQAAAAAESARLSAARQEQERLAAERAAADAELARQAAVRQEEQRQAAVKAEEERVARQRESDEKARIAKAALREKAIAQYQSVLEKYPGSTAAASATAKLKELGVAVALPPKVAATEPAPTELPENAQVLRLEVAQFAGFEFNLLERLPSYEVGRRISVPFEVINRGNGNDSFSLESGFPVGFNTVFASAAAPDQAITQTPSLAPGEAFKGVVSLTIPSASIDGLRITHPVKASSRLASEASQSRELGLIAAAPLLRAVLKVDKPQPLPSEKITYRVAVLNVGSTSGQDITFRLSFPPQLEPVDFAAAGFRLESKGALVLDGLQIKSGESKEYLLSFQLKEDSLAGQELLCRADLVNKQLGTSAAFVSNIANVKAVHGVAVKAGSERLSIIPGQTFTVPFVVTNTGNVREKFRLAPTVTGVQGITIFHDLNRDSIRQANEPVITELGPLEPKEEASFGLEITTTRTAADGSEGTIQITLAPEGEPIRAGVASTHLMFSRPVLQMSMAGQNGRLKPGEVASFDLTITNRGSNLAKVVELQSAWPEQLELVASDPANSSVSGGNIVWKFKELGAGEKRSIKVSFRIKFGTSVGTNIKVTNVLKYEDQLGNRY
ncbi:tetratricopeptide repeat protein [Geobacter chapellei]|uniref:Tetratricopeptide repeat protein n=1 Tax=Pelotalea chapellei TaxID=44671 RepID=A0ABS5U873_9BACT|nr:tetratricopeptide repeat protein [Pelotalea chapellei]MBT1071856.1 tetratricopeptide repeat protein [Pelotalea chapellei]